MLFPLLNSVITMPPELDQSARLRRMHNQAIRYALTEIMKTHHKERIKKHFSHTKQNQYKYYPRSRAYLARKKRLRLFRGGRPLTDLVKTGATEREMKRTIRIRISGGAGSKERKVKGVLRWPAGHKERGGSTGVTKEKMAEEIAQFTNQEETDISKEFLDHYLNYLQTKVRGKARLVSKHAALFASLGITA